MSADPPFSVAVDSSDALIVITVAGEVDAATAPALNEALESAIRDHAGHLVIDGNGITFIDSTGISVLIAAMRRLNRTRRRLALACEATGALGRALAATGLDHTFDCHGTAPAAVAVLTGAPLLGR